MQLLKREFGENVFFNWLNCVIFYWYGREMGNVVENC